MPSDPHAVAAEVVRVALGRQPTLGSGRLVCLDGPAGSGKTTLASAIRDVAGADVVHTDDMLEGWGGLPGLEGSVDAMVRPLATGRPGPWRRWDWHADRWAEDREVSPADLLVVEGAGAWSPRIADLVTVLVWVEADPATRLERGLTRDGEGMRARWLQWRRDEERLFGRLGTRARADVVVDTDDAHAPRCGP